MNIKLSETRKLFVVFLIAFACRSILALYRVFYGISFNYNLELYSDFNTYYVMWLRDFGNGNMLYVNIPYFFYPPGFILFLYPFYLLGLPMFPFFFLDALTAVLVFKVVSVIRPANAFSAGLAYALLPTALLYEGYVWFSTQPFLFFAVVATYFAVIGRPYFSGILLGVSFLMKQEAFIFFLPLLLYFFYEKRGINVLKVIVSASSVFILISLPYSIALPLHYIDAMTIGLAGFRGFAMPSNSFTSMHYMALSYAMVPVIIALWFEVKQMEINCFTISAVFFNAVLSVLFFWYILYPYRYYIIPLYVLLILGSNSKRSYLGLFIMSGLSLLLPSGVIQQIALSTYLTIHFALNEEKPPQPLVVT